ncbi:disulfide bond formation protein B [Sphingomonas sp.]|uniref:disulfide bond formation protein B n=1 Tax=Sphingomonas sp. TaxID=28214 RepID=UPI003CC67B37
MTATGPSNIARANWLALLLPAALLVGAWGSQLIGGLVPCEMCHWQRWPHYAAVPVAALALFAPGRLRVALVVLAALLVAVSGAIGVAHAGVEYHWWNGFTACTASAMPANLTAAQRLDWFMHLPPVMCDVPQWTLFGVSLAGFNAILSLGGAAVIGWLLMRRTR